MRRQAPGRLERIARVVPDERELGALIGKTMRGRDIVIVETEFNKGGIENYEPFDGYLVDQTWSCIASGLKVVLGFGNWA